MVESASTATASHYAQQLDLENPLMLFDAADRRPGYNLSPGTHPLAIYPDETVRAVHWGYCPEWASAKKLPQTINARAETASRARISGVVEEGPGAGSRRRLVRMAA